MRGSDVLEHAAIPDKAIATTTTAQPTQASIATSSSFWSLTFLALDLQAT
jgi:hypothetical protein